MAIDQVVIRLHRTLVEELRRRGHPENQPIRVADLYEHLVPYRVVRRRLGVELKADYEHALLRLLAGERNLLHLEPEDAREELRQEAALEYPMVGLFRKFSSSTVRVAMSEPGVAPDVEVGPGGETEAENRGSETRDATRERGPRLVPDGGPSAGDRSRVRVHGTVSSAQPAPREAPACADCGRTLPDGPPVRFCPYCGAEQDWRCPGCGAAVEGDWRYCVRCGAEVTGRP